MGILPARSANRATDKPIFANSGYLDPIAGDVFARLARGKSVLLIGTLGAGKSEVLRRVAERAKRRRRMQIALIDMGQPEPPHNPAEFWRDVLNALKPTEEARSTDDPAATTRLRMKMAKVTR